MSLRRFALAALASALVSGPVAAATQLLNVSYDPTRELYQAYNAAFIKHWKAQGGEDLTVQQSHGGSGKQARAVIDGLKADVVTLALAGDIDELHKLGKLLPADWQARLPDNSTPTPRPSCSWCARATQGNQGLGRPDQEGVEVITPNPKTSGGARWNFLAAWAWAKKQYGSDEKAKDYVQALYKHVPVLDTGARGSTITFVNNQIGDVLLAWENEAFLAKKEQGGKTSRSSYPPSPSLPNRRSRWSTRWSKRHPQGRRGLPAIPVQRGRPAHRRAELLPAAQPEGRRRVRHAVPETEPGHRRLRFRRLEDGPAKVLQRRGHLRPDLPGAMIATADPSPEPRPLSQTLSRTGEGLAGPVPYRAHCRKEPAPGEPPSVPTQSKDRTCHDAFPRSYPASG